LLGVVTFDPRAFLRQVRFSASQSMPLNRYVARARRATALHLAQARTTLRAYRRHRPDDVASTVLVAATSYPPRISHARLPILSLLHQTVRAREVVLVLAEDEFRGRQLPAWLDAAQANGLRILWTPDNTRSYKKLVPLLTHHGHMTIVTADDDTVYPSWWLEGLIAAASRRPRTIVGYRGNEIALTPTGLRPYTAWPRASRATPPNRVFLKGNGGILYPPGSLPQRAADMRTALQLCPTADDVWFRAMSLLQGTDVGTATVTSVTFPSIRASQKSGRLSRRNVDESENDRQIHRVLDHFSLWPTLRADDVSSSRSKCEASSYDSDLSTRRDIFP
jgi:hypothetical protein